jgi:hypothetical protein
MHHIASQHMGMKFRSALNINAESFFLGGTTPGVSATRVMAANIQSSSVRPADLDAFLRGPFKEC